MPLQIFPQASFGSCRYRHGRTHQSALERTRNPDQVADAVIEASCFTHDFVACEPLFLQDEQVATKVLDNDKAKVRCVLILPKSRKPFGMQLGITHGVLHVLVAQIMLNRARVVGIVGELKARRMPEHMRMYEEGKACGLPRPGQELAEVGIGHGTFPLRHKHIRALWRVPFDPA